VPEAHAQREFTIHFLHSVQRIIVDFYLDSEAALWFISALKWTLNGCCSHWN